MHLALVPAEDDVAVAQEEVHHLAVFPAAVLGQAHGCLVVADGDQWLDAVLVAAVKDCIVVREARLARFGVVTVGEDAAPGDGHAVALEAHLAKEGDVLLKAVVVVDGHVAGVDFALHALGEGDLARMGAIALRHEVSRARALAVRVPRALALVCGRRAAPQKAFRKSHRYVLSLFVCPYIS